MTKDSEELRGRSKAYMGIGVVAAAGWAALELLPFLEGPCAVVGDKGIKSTHKLAMIVGFVGIGAAALALDHHFRATKIEEESKKTQFVSLPETSWVFRIVGEPMASSKKLETIAR